MKAAGLTRRIVQGTEDERVYLAALNQCFPHWGDRAMFDWCFTRESAGLSPDLLWLCAADGPVAGTANTYRQLRLANGRTVRAAIMTGSWTLPAARGLGAFTRIIAESRTLAAERHAGLLLAFVTTTNASFGRLRDAGAALFPTAYCRSAGEPSTNLADSSTSANESSGDADDPRWMDLSLDTADSGLELLLSANASASGGSRRSSGGENAEAGVRAGVEAEAGFVSFTYAGEEWRDQFLRRPSQVALVSGADRWRALVERAPLFDRLLALAIRPDQADTPVRAEAIRTLSARASSAGRRLFSFSSDARHTARLSSLGFESVGGALTALIADAAVLRAALAVDPAVEEATSLALADPASPWFLGGWSVQNGDRM